MKFLDLFSRIYKEGQAITFDGWTDGRVLFMPGGGWVMEYTSGGEIRPYFRTDGAEQRHAENRSDGWRVVPMPVELEGFSIEAWVASSSTEPTEEVVADGK